jgi:hypothetical protein
VFTHARAFGYDRVMKGGHAVSFERQRRDELGARAGGHYSLLACLVVALFGGPLAAVAISALNASRARQPRRELAWLAISALVALAVLLGIAWWALQPQNRGDFGARVAALSLAPVASVVLGLISWRRVSGSFSAPHAVRLKGLPLWGHGLLLIVGAQALQLLVNALATQLWR